MYHNHSRIFIILKIILLIVTTSSLSIEQKSRSHQTSIQLIEIDLVIEDESNQQVKYEPNWESLDARPLPTWYDQSKIGIFIHWGVFSVPSFGSEWFWYDWKGFKYPNYIEFMNENYPPGFSYQNFGHEFKAEFYNATQWAQLFQKAGAKYVVLTSKHHEGYTLWPSKYSFSWNAMDVGPHRDLLGELADAIRSVTDIKFGLYHSLYEFFNPIYLADKISMTQDFVNFKTLPELYEIVNTYHPEIVWSDGDWEQNDTYWKSTEFLAWLYNESPVKDTVLTNDRWGHGTSCKHGGFYTCQDRFNPGVLQPHKWENCYTLDKHSWGYRRNAKLEDYLTPEELIKTMVETVACGGNYLINVGPTKEGTIPLIQQERLVQMGEWLDVNGEAIYNTVPWDVQNDTLTSGVWYTSNPNENKIYAISVQWPGDELNLASVDSSLVENISILGCEEEIEWSQLSPKGIKIKMPAIETCKSKWSWTVSITQKA